MRERLNEFQDLLHKVRLDTHSESFYERDYEDFCLHVKACEDDLHVIVETWQRLMDSIVDPKMKEKVFSEYGDRVQRLKEEFEDELQGFQKDTGYCQNRSIGSYDPLSESEIEDLLNELPELIYSAHGFFDEAVANKRNRSAAGFVWYAQRIVNDTVNAYQNLLDDIDDPDEKDRVLCEFGPQVKEITDSLASVLEELPGNEPRRIITVGLGTFTVRSYLLE